MLSSSSLFNLSFISLLVSVLIIITSCTKNDYYSQRKSFDILQAIQTGSIDEIKTVLNIESNQYNDEISELIEKVNAEFGSYDAKGYLEDQYNSWQECSDSHPSLVSATDMREASSDNTACETFLRHFPRNDEIVSFSTEGCGTFMLAGVPLDPVYFISENNEKRGVLELQTTVSNLEEAQTEDAFLCGFRVRRLM